MKSSTFCIDLIFCNNPNTTAEDGVVRFQFLMNTSLILYMLVTTFEFSIHMITEAVIM